MHSDMGAGAVVCMFDAEDDKDDGHYEFKATDKLNFDKVVPVAMTAGSPRSTSEVNKKSFDTLLGVVSSFASSHKLLQSGW